MSEGVEIGVYVVLGLGIAVFFVCLFGAMAIGFHGWLVERRKGYDARDL